MTQRAARAKFLGEQLSTAMQGLGQATRSTDALLFLDRLARLEGYQADDLNGMDDLAALVVAARAARDEHVTALGTAAGRGLNLERFLDAGRHLPEDDIIGERDGWLRDLLLLATVMPWLTPTRRGLAQGVLAQAQAMISAEPKLFLAASALANDRWEYECPETLSGEAQAVLMLLNELPLLVMFERTIGAEIEVRVDRALAVAGSVAIDEANDALLDRELRRNLRLPHVVEPVRLYAADDVGFPFCRVATGVWEIVRRAGRASLRWNSDGEYLEAKVEILEGVNTGVVLQDAHGEFPLPSAQDTLSLKLHVGPDSRVVRLELSDD